MTLIQSFCLGLLQSLTEFLPVSSSGHLILVPALLHWPDQGLAFDVIIHLGTAAAAMIYFRRDILALFDWPRSKRSWVMVSVALLPTVIAGFLLKDAIELYARDVSVVAFNLILWGLVLIGADVYSRRNPGTAQLTDLQWPQALFIGLAQSIALIPGTSRSGSTLAVALFLGLARVDAVKFSFLIGIPAMLGAGLLSIVDLAQGAQAVNVGPLIVGFVVSMLGGLVAIHLLMALLRYKALTYFGVYRIVLGLILLRLL
jgi:undecaprenyl-diphosphatase